MEGRYAAYPGHMTTPSGEALLKALREDPEFLAAVRREVLTDDLLALPEITASLARRLDDLAQRHADLTGVVAGLAQHLSDLAERVGDLTKRVDDLTKRVDELTVEVRALTRRLDALTARLDALVEQMRDFGGRLGDAVGELTELRYRERGPAYFGRIARRLALLSWPELDDLLDRGIGEGALTLDEADQVRLADAVFRGRRQDETVHLVVEASHGAGIDDVTRAAERAALLTRIDGVTAIPVVAGKYVLPDAGRMARGMGVWQAAGGWVTPPDAPAA